MITNYRLVLMGAFAAAFEQSQGMELNGSAAASYANPVLDFTLNSMDQVTPVSQAVPEKSSLWHAFDGVPFLFSRPNHRKLSKTYQSRDELDASHRSLAFGDYVDQSFSCPFTTTCPNVCVAEASDCPADATCAAASSSPDHEFALCADGTCADLTLGEACAADLETPCGCSKLSVACAKQIDLWDTCHDRFQVYYDVHAQCLDDEAEAVPPPTMTTAPVLFALVMVVITLLMFVWCAFNQRLSPVSGSSMDMENELGEKWTQTGYKSNIVGKVLYGLIVLGHVSIQALLLLVTFHYCKLSRDNFSSSDLPRHISNNSNDSSPS